MLHPDLHGGLVWALLSCFLGLSASLKDVRVSVPQAILSNGTAVFMCDFDLEGETLYSVKWYKGRSEFFRFSPKDEFPIKIFPLDGFNIDTSKSSMHRLTLKHVTPALSGKYSCEVSAESSFHTELVSGEMDVVEVPSHRPEITGLQMKYRVGETLRANCTSGWSKPPTNLTWFINNEVANPVRVYRYPPTELNNNNLNNNATTDPTLYTTKSSIQFVVTTHDFITGHLKIKCTANIHSIYDQSTERGIEEERRINTDSTQIVVMPANFLNNEMDDEGYKKRRYSSGNDSSSSLFLRRPPWWSSVPNVLVLLILLLR